jgi:hypothetical protein
MIDLGPTSNPGTPSTPPPSPQAPPPTVTRIEENGGGVTYSGNWFNNAGVFNSGSAAKLAMDANSRATLTFNGVGATWIGYGDQWSGIARVYVDGKVASEVDTYATSSKPQATLYSVSNLSDGPHTLTIEATGQKNPASGGAWIWVDAFDVMQTSSGGGSTPPPPPAPPSNPVPPSTTSSYRVEQTNAAVAWSGDWSINNGSFNSGGSAKLSATVGARATFTFTGTSASWISYRDNWSGIASVFVDGVLAGTIDNYASPAKAQAVAYTVSGLTQGTHSIAIQVTGTKNLLSKASWIWVDAFDYVGAATASALSTDRTSVKSPVSSLAGGVSLTSAGGPSMVIGSAEVSGGPVVGGPLGLAVISYRQNGVLATEAGVPANVPVSAGRFYVEISPYVKTGFAIVNPNEAEATISFFFTDSNGTDSGSGTLKLAPHAQTARFLDQTPFNATGFSNGTFSFSSNIPVSAIALRGLINERSEFLITTLPIANPDQITPATVFFPHFADGGGWTTQFLLANPTDETINGTFTFFSPAGQPVSAAQYSIPPRSSRRLATPGTATDLRVGSAQATPNASNAAPFGVAVFSLRKNGVTVSEAGVPSLNTGKAFRLFAESSNDGLVRSGIAILNSSDVTANVTVDLINLDGSSAGRSGSLQISAFGQRALFLNEIPGLESVSNFKGFARITSDRADLAIVGLRGHANERDDFLITTTPPIMEDSRTPGGTKTVFPHVVDGGGFTTQFILYGSGTLDVHSQSGGSLSLGLK